LLLTVFGVRRRFGRKQVDTSFAAPFFVAGNGVEDFLRRSGGVGLFDQGAGVGEDGEVVDFKLEYENSYKLVRR